MKLSALFYFVLSLFGCSTATNVHLTRTIVDGSDTLYSMSTARDGVARFECRGSESGHCYYAVYSDTCDPAGNASACDPSPLREFALAVGSQQQITGLQDFHLCVSAHEDVRGPDCEN
ncbi:hypothetical protein [Novilysobacter spongiicola]|uniref:Lipoprotein n=1 Tax=Lysobacter spongiicola DSM 21749 TaxID=1122188 RepID=A0A1T4SI93_9GAMM|nr:hypothetical protein [Lysobacter spongiicola]SKA28040.1 hypothetical protein SAMN02745674_02893 [Lysobacter spongiicola DSM 21749]